MASASKTALSYAQPISQFTKHRHTLANPVYSFRAQVLNIYADESYFFNTIRNYFAVMESFGYNTSPNNANLLYAAAIPMIKYQTLCRYMEPDYSTLPLDVTSLPMNSKHFENYMG